MCLLPSIIMLSHIFISLSLTVWSICLLVCLFFHSLSSSFCLDLFISVESTSTVILVAYGRGSPDGHAECLVRSMRDWSHYTQWPLLHLVFNKANGLRIEDNRGFENIIAYQMTNPRRNTKSLKSYSTHFIKYTSYNCATYVDTQYFNKIENPAISFPITLTGISAISDV